MDLENTLHNFADDHGLDALYRHLAANLTPATMQAVVRDLLDAPSPVPADLSALAAALCRQLSVMGVH